MIFKRCQLTHFFAHKLFIRMNGIFRISTASVTVFEILKTKIKIFATDNKSYLNNEYIDINYMDDLKYFTSTYNCLLCCCSMQQNYWIWFEKKKTKNVFGNSKILHTFRVCAMNWISSQHWMWIYGAELIIIIFHIFSVIEIAYQ